jgi:hypothetical protein
VLLNKSVEEGRPKSKLIVVKGLSKGSKYANLDVLQSISAAPGECSRS